MLIMNDNDSVPWTCKAELLGVYHNLYSESTRDRQNALEHIAVWTARCNSRLPVSIICSADLIRAELDRHIYSRRQSALTENNVRQSLALALIRFVNFITERYQRDSSNVAIPIHRIGAQIGIPGWVVTLRHEATHRTMPSLCLLTRGAQWAIQWLKENFWERQVAEPPLGLDTSNSNILTDSECVAGTRTDEDVPTSSIGATVANKKVSCLFVAYQQIRFQEVSGKTFSIRDISTGKEGREVINEIKKQFSLGKDRAMSVLVQPGYLIPTDDQLAKLGIKPGVHGDEKIKRVLAVVWWPLLQEMNNLRIVTNLVQRLALLMTEDECPRSRYILIWLQLLLNRNVIRFLGGGKAQLFGNSFSFLELPWLQQCLQNPNKYTQDLLRVLTCGETGSLTEAATEKLTDMINICMVQGESKEPQSSDTDSPIYSVSDLRSENSHGADTLGSSWKQCTEKVDWGRLPVGILPWQDPECLFHYLNNYCETVQSQLQDEDIEEHNGMMDVDAEDVSSARVSGTICWDTNQLQSILSQITIFD